MSIDSPIPMKPLEASLEKLKRPDIGILRSQKSTMCLLQKNGLSHQRAVSSLATLAVTHSEPLSLLFPGGILLAQHLLIAALLIGKLGWALCQSCV